MFAIIVQKHVLGHNFFLHLTMLKFFSYLSQHYRRANIALSIRYNCIITVNAEIMTINVPSYDHQMMTF